MKNRREVATERGWPSTWLNNQAAGYVSRTPGGAVSCSIIRTFRWRPLPRSIYWQ
jgi:hypothetical protein